MKPQTKQKQKQLIIMDKEELLTLQYLSGLELKTYLALALYRGKEGLSFPSVTTLTKLTGSKRPSIQRALSRLKERALIVPIGKTNTGVIKYRIGGIDTDTCNQTDTCIDTDTGGVSVQIGGGIDIDTGGVSVSIPRTAKLTTTLTTNISASTDLTDLAKTEDEKLFLLLWEKWKGVHLWECSNKSPLPQYRVIRDPAVKSPDWNGKDVLDEIKAIDLYLMQKAPSNRMIWGKEVFLSTKGLKSWFASRTPSNIEKYPKSLRQKVICLPAPEFVDYTPKTEEAPKIAIKPRLGNMPLSLHLKEILDGFLSIPEYENRALYMMKQTTKIIITEEENKLLQNSTNPMIDEFLFFVGMG